MDNWAKLVWIWIESHWHTAFNWDNWTHLLWSSRLFPSDLGSLTVLELTPMNGDRRPWRKHAFTTATLYYSGNLQNDERTSFTLWPVHSLAEVLPDSSWPQPRRNQSRQRTFRDPIFTATATNSVSSQIFSIYIPIPHPSWLFFSFTQYVKSLFFFIIMIQLVSMSGYQLRYKWRTDFYLCISSNDNVEPLCPCTTMWAETTTYLPQTPWTQKRCRGRFCLFVCFFYERAIRPLQGRSEWDSCAARERRSRRQWMRIHQV